MGETQTDSEKKGDGRVILELAGGGGVLIREPEPDAAAPEWVDTLHLSSDSTEVVAPAPAARAL